MLMRRARLAGAAPLAVAVALLGGVSVLASGGRQAAQLAQGTVLPAGKGFTLAGAVHDLAPGVPAALVLTAANPHRAPIVVTRLTASITHVPWDCPASALRLTGRRFRGQPPAVAVSGAWRVRPARSARITLPLRLDRAAPNSCQRVRFPFAFHGSAAYGVTGVTATTMVPQPAPSRSGRDVRFQATVTLLPRGSGSAAGWVTFRRCRSPRALAAGSSASACHRSVALGNRARVIGGRAGIVRSDLAPGAYSVFARFTPGRHRPYPGSTSRTATYLVGHRQGEP